MGRKPKKSLMYINAIVCASARSARRAGAHLARFNLFGEAVVLIKAATSLYTPAREKIMFWAAAAASRKLA